MSATKRKVLNIAHRGARAYAPENTLPAFAKAKLFGCEMFEMDVRMSKDEIIVAYHDEHLLRCTNAPKIFPDRPDYDLKNFTFSELKQLDAGSWYVEQLALPKEQRQAFLQSLTENEKAAFISRDDISYYASGAVSIPSLDETLSLACELDLMVNIELKSPIERPDVFIDSVLNTIKAKGMQDQILISSFDHDYLRLVRRRERKIPTATLNDQPIKAPITYLRKLRANGYNIGFYHDYSKDKFESKPGKRYLADLLKLSKAGFSINNWTINSPEEMEYLLAAGTSGLITDYPNRAAAKIADFYESVKIAQFKNDLSTA